jgi:hypothetical protein
MRVITKGLIVVSALVMTSCVGSSTSEPTQTTSPQAARVLSSCTDVAAPSLGPGTLCISNGFRINRDNFSFANWGRSQRADDNVTAQTLIDLFGYDTVCAPGPQSECVLRPTAVQFLDLWNTALSGGRCEGLAALSARLHLSLDSPIEFGSQYAQVTQLTRQSSDINQSIVYWWATQFAKEVSRSAGDSRRKSPITLVGQLIQGLANNLGYTIGLYFQSQGHSVTPFAVTNRDDNFVIHVYDNNFPNKRREILVNKTTNTWTYRGASTGIDGSAIDWTGGTGSFELTSMSSRQGPFTCPFCTTIEKDSPTVVSLASRDPRNPGFIRITSRRGDAEFSAAGFRTTIDGATVEIGKGAGGLVTIYLPAEVTEFDIAVTHPLPTVPAGDVLLSVDRPGFARMQIAGNFARYDGAAPMAVVTARKNNTSVVAPTDASVDVTLARSGTLITKELQPAEEFDVSRSSKTEIEVSVKGSSPEQSLVIPIADSAISQRANIVRMSDNSFDVQVATPTSVRARPQRTVNFVPRKAPPRKTPTTSTTLPSIEISEPD